MTSLYSPFTLAVAAALVVTLLLASPNVMLWAACVLMVPIGVWLLGGRRAYPVLVWLIAFNWLQIVGDVLGADLSGRVLADGWMGQYRERAIYFSLCAILAMALGMRCGTRLGGWVFRSNVQPTGASVIEDERSVGLHRAVGAYFISLVLTQALDAFAIAVPGLTQQVLAVGLVKFVCVYLVASKVFTCERGYQWLVLVALCELATGLGGFFANYKEAFFVMLIALAASRGAMSARKWLFAGIALIVVVWVALVWTVIKGEYRYQVFSNPLQERVEWMTHRFFVAPIDYGAAVTKLVERVGYTDLYAQLLARLDIGSVPTNLGLYAGAVEHILKPRILFPDKSSLDDSKLTTALLGMRIDKNTSIGVGFVAEAHVDFGFPGLLPALLVLGALIGLAAQYFMTRSAPLPIRTAFTTAILFNSFTFGTNIDKALGVFITAWIAMALALKFGYPLVAEWLAGRRVDRRLNAGRAVSEIIDLK
jgi:hypothetical protein